VHPADGRKEAALTFLLEMSFAEAVGFVGVFLLLAAFFMNLVGMLSTSSLVYICLNLFGAGLACYASYLVDFMPFVILEGTWALVAAFALGRLAFRKAVGQGAMNTGR
jgi:hypothetical protein